MDAIGAAELSPLVLLRAVNRCVAATLDRSGRSQRSRCRFLFFSFWHGLLGLNARWQPQTPIYTWADSRADRRRSSICGAKNLNENQVHANTGCRIHSSYWPAKLRWLRDLFADPLRKSRSLGFAG